MISSCFNQSARVRYCHDGGRPSVSLCGDSTRVLLAHLKFRPLDRCSGACPSVFVVRSVSAGSTSALRRFCCSNRHSEVKLLPPFFLLVRIRRQILPGHAKPPRPLISPKKVLTQKNYRNSFVPEILHMKPTNFRPRRF